MILQRWYALPENGRVKCQASAKVPGQDCSWTMIKLASSWKWDSAKVVTAAMTPVRMVCAVGPVASAAATMRSSPNSSPSGLNASVTPSVETMRPVAGVEGDGLIGEGGVREDAEDRPGALERQNFRAAEEDGGVVARLARR